MSPFHPVPGYWTLEHLDRPWSLNDERAQHWSVRRARTEEWRGVFHLLALEAKIPRLVSVSLSVQPYLKGRQQDTGNCYPAVKAAIDGLVDAGVIPDDTPEYVSAITFLAPEKASENRLVLGICGRPCLDQHARDATNARSKKAPKGVWDR